MSYRRSLPYPQASSLIVNLIRNSFRQTFCRRLLVFLLILNLLIWPGANLTILQLPALAANAIDATADSVRIIPRFFSSLFGPGPQREETPYDRIARVFRVHISPSKFVGYQDQTVAFAAMGTDFTDETIQGLSFEWSTSDPDKVQIDETGRANFLQPGLARIRCRAGMVEASVPVLIRRGQRPMQTDDEWLLDQSSLVADTETITGPNLLASLVPTLIDKLVPTAFAGGGSTSDKPYDELWTEPRNLVGSPQNRAIESTQQGPLMPESCNLNFSVPLVRLSGRGRAADIKLYYNSRVWTRRGNSVSFDAIYSGPVNSDKKCASFKVDWNHHEKALYRSFQSETRS